MKKIRLKKIKWVFFLSLTLLTGLASCVRNQAPREYNEALRYLKDADYVEAEKKFEASIIRYPVSSFAVLAAREGSRVSYYETKNYPLARFFYKHLVLYSPDSKERIESQEKIADINFFHLSDYASALTEYSRLLDVVRTTPEIIKYQFQIARSHFYLNRLSQARSEIDSLLKKNLDRNQKFDALFLKANVCLSMKLASDAITIFQTLLKDFPQRSQQENIKFNMAVAYEDLQDYEKSIEILRELKKESKNDEFLELRIRRLLGRKENLPGGRGFKR